MKKMCTFEIKCQALKPLDIPGEWEDHPDTKRLDWLLRYISFETFVTNERQYVHICIESTVYANLTWRLERGWRQIDSNDPREIIDKAMEENNGN